MKSWLLSMLAFLMFPLVIMAQAEDDDMYSFGKKKSTEVKVAKSKATSTAERTYTPTVRTERDVDEYNRRGSASQVVARLVDDTLYVTTADSTQKTVMTYSYENPQIAEVEETEPYSDNYYDEDFYYTSRLARYRGLHFYDPFVWDVCYGWYDPWYDPWYGWYAPYYRYGYHSWYSWGWGWGCAPGWDMCWGHHGHYRDHLPKGSYMPARNHGQREATMTTPGRANGRYSGTSLASRGSRTSNGRVTSSAAASRRSEVATSGRGTISSNRSTSYSQSRPQRSSSTVTNRTSTPSRSSSSYSRGGTSSPSRSSSMSSGSFGGSRGGGFSGGGFSGGSRGGGGRGGR